MCVKIFFKFVYMFLFGNIWISNIFAASSNNGSQPKAILDIVKNIAPVFIILVIFYIFLIIPQNKRKKKQEEMIASIKKGEEILTSSGLFGKIASVDEASDTVLLEIAKGVEVKILKSQIINIIGRKDSSALKSKKTA